ncbi:MAG: lysophospholipid acyltransferase family protein [Thermodesulfobacteriota bacterium]
MYLRSFLVWTAGLPVTGVLFSIILLSLLVDRSGRIVHSIGAFWCRIILALAGIRVEVRGRENISGEGPKIFLSNHQGAFDIPVLQGYIPRQFRWVAKKSLFSIPVVGWTMTLAGYVGIERENSKKALKSLLLAAEKIRNGTSVLIFPEGTRSTTGTLLPFKKGAFLLARKSGADIVPLAVEGTKDIMKKGSLMMAPAKATLSIGEPFSPKGMSDEELMEKTLEAIKGLLRH